MTVGCAFGLLDECIKILLPTREFDAVDLMKDWMGVSVAVGVIWLFYSNRKNGKNRNRGQ